MVGWSAYRTYELYLDAQYEQKEINCVPSRNDGLLTIESTNGNRVKSLVNQGVSQASIDELTNKLTDNQQATNLQHIHITVNDDSQLPAIIRDRLNTKERSKLIEGDQRRT